jgi:hypothetical protein
MLKMEGCSDLLRVYKGLDRVDILKGFPSVPGSKKAGLKVI